MANAKFIPIITTTTGLNNYVDPVRLKVDLRTGETELSQAVNVDIDNTGRISRRRGRIKKWSGSAKYGYSYGETCLFVSDTTLYRLHPDYSIEALRTGLTENARMHYCAVANRIYYINENEKGYISEGQDNAWTKGDYTYPGDPRRSFSDPPNGHLVGWFAGRMLVARDNAVFASLPSFYGVFDLPNDFKLFPERITMLQPTLQGIWVGTEDRILFYRGDRWDRLRREPKASYRVLEGSVVECPGENLGIQERAFVFTTDKGICIGSESGILTNLTRNKLNFPSGRYANAAIAGDRYIVLIEP